MAGAVSLRRLALESLAIISSILLAFAIDAWWEGSKESQRRNSLLGDLKHEVLTNIEDLERNSRRQELYYEDSKKMVGALLGEVELTPTAFDELKVLLDGYPVFLPSWGVLDLLTNSGDLVLIEDSRLRTKLANLKSDVSIYVDNQELAIAVLTADVTLFETGDFIFPYDLPEGERAKTPVLELQQRETALKARQYPMFLWEVLLKEQGQTLLRDLREIAALLP
ncbi:MAG: hypothetical protein AAGG55_10470 [Pseudomonadota bacterium]